LRVRDAERTARDKKEWRQYVVAAMA